MATAAAVPSECGQGYVRVALLVGVVFATLTGLGASWHVEGTPEAFDATRFHVPAIARLARQLPRLDISQFEAAMSPGYHVLMALCWRSGLSSLTALSWVNALIGLAFVLTLLRCLERHAGACRAGWLVLPLACSPYVIRGSIWLMTDNTAWLLVVLAMNSLMATRGTVAAAVRAGLLAAGAVWTRQVQLWLVVPLVIGFWPRIRRIALAVVPPLTVCAWLFVQWGGLVPSTFRSVNVGSGFNPAFVPMTLALCGAFGIFMVAPCRREWLDSSRDSLVLGATVTGLMPALLIPTSCSHEAGRWGGALWELVRVTPVVLDRSLTMAVLGALGGMVLAMLWRRAQAAGQERIAVILFACLAASMIGHSASSRAFQRYAEPMTLIAVTWLAALGARPASRWQRVLPLVPAALQVLLLLVSLHRAVGPMAAY